MLKKMEEQDGRVQAGQDSHHPLMILGHGIVNSQHVSVIQREKSRPRHCTLLHLLQGNHASFLDVILAVVSLPLPVMRRCKPPRAADPNTSALVCGSLREAEPIWMHISSTSLCWPQFVVTMLHTAHRKGTEKTQNITLHTFNRRSWALSGVLHQQQEWRVCR